jgi:hypothetical protein
MLARFDGNNVDMTSLKCAKSNPVGCVLGLLDTLFTNEYDSVNTLDRRQEDEDPRIQAIKSECLDRPYSVINRKKIDNLSQYLGPLIVR